MDITVTPFTGAALEGGAELGGDVGATALADTGPLDTILGGSLGGGQTAEQVAAASMAPVIFSGGVQGATL